MTDYTARDIHLLDQSYPDALASIEHLTGDPARKRHLADVGAEVFAAELTRELAATFDNPMSLAGWAAIATARLMEAGRAWEEDTDMAWAKVDELTAELDRARADERNTIAADIEDMPINLGDAGWKHLETKADEASYPTEWVRRRRTRDDFTTATIEVAYQYGYRQAAKVARGEVAR